MKKELKELVKYLSDNAEIHVDEKHAIVLIDFCDMYNFLSRLKKAFDIQLCDYEFKGVLKEGYMGFDFKEILEELDYYEDENNEFLEELKKWREKP